MYINTETNQYPLSISAIRKLHPNTAFPQPFVAPPQYALVYSSTQPAYNQHTQAIRETAPILVDGKYEQQWEVYDLPLTPEEYTQKLDTLKAQKREAVQRGKVIARDGGFDIDGTHYDSDLPARMSYNELAVRLQQNPTYSTPWKASEGQWVTMDAPLYASVVTHGEAHMTAVFTWQATKEAEINACTTIEQLEAVSVMYGE